MAGTLAVRRFDVGDALADTWRSLLGFVPRAAAFVAILLAGYVLARVIRRLTDAVLERVRFDGAVGRGRIGRVLVRRRYDVGQVCARLASLVVLLFTLWFAFGVWGPNPVSDLIGDVVAWLPRAFAAIVVVVVTVAIAGAVRDLLRSALGGLSYGRGLATTAATVIVGLGVVAALGQAGITAAVTTPLLVAVLATVFGVIVVGVGGGLVRPLWRRWRGRLSRVTTEVRMIGDRILAYCAEHDTLPRRERRRQGEVAERTGVLPVVRRSPAPPVATRARGATAGGVAAGGVAAGGTPAAGAPTGGAPTNGAPTGAAPTGAAPTAAATADAGGRGAGKVLAVDPAYVPAR
jgi:hypothetical protein